MTQTDPAAKLHAAADKLRALLADLDDCRGPWYVVNRERRPYPQRIDNIGVPYVVASTTTDPSHPPTIADYICAMHPGVGLALAEWLESTALTVDAVAKKIEPDPGAHWLAPALTVAREVLGTTGEQPAVTQPEPTVADTLAQWLYRRFTVGLTAPLWDGLTDDDQSYWEHEARAVRRAVARGGFKDATPATTEGPAS